jgi:hypothetical protein
MEDGVAPCLEARRAKVPLARPSPHLHLTRLLESPGVSEETAKSLAGHVSKRMLERYSHIRTERKRDAIAELAAASAEMAGPELQGLQDVVQSTPQPPPLAH